VPVGLRPTRRALNVPASSVAAVVPVFDRPSDLQRWSEAQRRDGHTIALVPTMGALHRGHLSLIEAARERADRVVVSIFVNPLQFGEQADFEHYPRPIDVDITECDRVGVDVVYAPTSATMYPPGFATTVHVDGITDPMEGRARPGHFDGVATVVAKLFAACRPHVAVFGEKDYQQLAVVRTMTADLDLGVDVVGCRTVREPDGLAMSSRNRRLDVAERAAAGCLPAAIAAAIATASAVQSTPVDVVAAAVGVIDDQPLANLDYVSVFDATTLAPLESFDSAHRRPGQVRIAVAARIGDVRLIDNADLFAD
jgi:pantoate--beta-alanine ligase